MAREPRALPYARLELLSAHIAASHVSQASMATPAVPASVALYEAAEGLRVKGHYARAAEKFGRAAAAAAQELAAEDCLVVASLRATQADALICHSLVPTLSVAEQVEARQTVVSVLLPQSESTVTCRKAAGTLLPGSCRAAEVAWWRATSERTLCGGLSVENVRTGAVASAPELGFEAFMCTAITAIKLLTFGRWTDMPREVELSHAAFVTSAFDLMAQPRELASAVLDNGATAVFPSAGEQNLAQNARQVLLKAPLASCLDAEAKSLKMLSAWCRVERSGVVAARRLADDPNRSMATIFTAAAAEAAVRGLRECALEGCAAKEVHVSQFKRCSACHQAFYCCREHQVADWPAHKAACKAARKQAADPET